MKAIIAAVLIAVSSAFADFDCERYNMKSNAIKDCTEEELRELMINIVTCALQAREQKQYELIETYSEWLVIIHNHLNDFRAKRGEPVFIALPPGLEWEK